MGETVRTNITIESLKKRAKSMVKEQYIKHAAALDIVAKSNGFANYSHFLNERQSGSVLVEDASHVILRISLLESSIEISRLVRVPLWLTMGQLHGVIQLAMGWADAHLYEFEISGMPSLTGPQFLNDHKSDEDELDVDANEVGLQAIIERRVSPFFYTYDFGDNWVHQIDVVSTAVDNNPNEIELISAKGFCPPEDCSSHYGHEKLLLAYSMSAKEWRNHYEFDDQWSKSSLANYYGRQYNPHNQPNVSAHQKALEIFLGACSGKVLTKRHTRTKRLMLNSNRGYDHFVDMDMLDALVNGM